MVYSDDINYGLAGDPATVMERWESTYLSSDQKIWRLVMKKWILPQLQRHIIKIQKREDQGANNTA